MTRERSTCRGNAARAPHLLLCDAPQVIADHNMEREGGRPKQREGGMNGKRKRKKEVSEDVPHDAARLANAQQP